MRDKGNFTRHATSYPRVKTGHLLPPSVIGRSPLSFQSGDSLWPLSILVKNCPKKLAVCRE